MIEVIALREYTDKFISLYEGEIRNINETLASRLLAQNIVALHTDGSGSSELPPVTSSDNGKILTVVEGQWNKAENSGGSGLQNFVDGNVEGSVRGINSKIEDNNYILGKNAFSVNENTQVFGIGSTAFGKNTIAFGDYSIAEGQGQSTYNYNITVTRDSTISNKFYVNSPLTARIQKKCGVQYFSDKEGYKIGTISNIYSDRLSFATSFTLPNTTSEEEITLTIFCNGAFGENSHTEGRGTLALDFCSHAEGFGTIASEGYSHAEGLNTVASGQISHAEGDNTIAQRSRQLVIGKYNILDTGGLSTLTQGDYIFIIGNGSSTQRSNAFTVDWSGNTWTQGKMTVGTGPTNNMDVATKQYVDEAIATAIANLNN